MLGFPPLTTRVKKRRNILSGVEPVSASAGGEKTAPLAHRTARLRDLGFRRAISVDTGASIARRFGKTVRCGIYVLEFANDDWYVGQAVDVTKRFLDHRRTYDDIVRVHFQSVPRKRLDAVEREMIAELEGNGWILRNVAMASYPRGASLLDEVLQSTALTNWRSSVDTSIEDGPRRDLEAHRHKYRRKYKHFSDRPKADRMERILRAYATVALPAPRTTEMDFWSVSCLPNGPSDDVAARVNMFWQEVFTLGISAGPVRPFMWASFHVADSVLPNSLLSRLTSRLRHPLHVRNRSEYVVGGSDQARLYVEGEARIMRLLSDPSVVLAMRAMNARLMRKGRCNAAPSHCLDLADRMLADGD